MIFHLIIFCYCLHQHHLRSRQAILGIMRNLRSFIEMQIFLKGKMSAIDYRNLVVSATIHSYPRQILAD